MAINTVTRLTSNGTFQSLGGFDEVSLSSGSIYFKGTTDLILANNASLNIVGTGNFTIESYVYISGAIGSSGYSMIISQDDGGSGNQGFQLGVSSSYKVRFLWWTGSSRATATNIATTTNCNPNSWNHVAVSWDGTTLRIFINGILGASTTSFSPFNSGITTTGIGNYWTTSLFTNAALIGYLSNVRMVKGTAVYTSNFTPPSAPLLPITNTVLLLTHNPQSPYINSSINNPTITKAGTSFNTFGPFYYPANTAINIANTSNNPILGSNTNIISSTTSNGVVMISNGFDEVTFAPGSIYFNGSSYLTTPTVNMGSNNFTIETWFYYTTPPGQFTSLITQQNLTTQSVAEFSLAISGNNIVYSLSSVGNQYDIAYEVLMGVAQPNTWNHIALVRNGNLFTPYLNGLSGVPTSNSSPLYNTSACTAIAATQTGAMPTTGYFSNIRIVKGTAVYTANFAPPTMALTNIANTVMLLNTYYTNPFADSSSNNNTITTHSNPTASYLTPITTPTTVQRTTNTGIMLVGGYFNEVDPIT